jgi:hypothetical protein
MQKDKTMDIIADYYMTLGCYTPNERYSESNVRVYTSPESECWLVLERKGENAIQARMTDENGVIVSWDNYNVMNAAISQIEAVRLSVSGRSEILFTPAELMIIDKYADYDRKTTMGKLDILEGRFRNDTEEKDAKAVIDKLGRISDKSFTDLYSVRQRKMTNELENSVHNRMEQAKVRADKYNAEHRSQTVDHKRERGTVL